MRSFITPAFVATLAAASMVAAQAQTLTSPNTVTVRPGGPRTGASGTNFLNVEGNNNGVNASFGVVDFMPTASPTATGVSNLVLKLTESDAAFSLPGPFNVYLASNTGATSSLAFDSTQAGNGGIGNR